MKIIDWIKSIHIHQYEENNVMHIPDPEFPSVVIYKTCKICGKGRKDVFSLR